MGHFSSPSAPSSMVSLYTPPWPLPLQQPGCTTGSSSHHVVPAMIGIAPATLVHTKPDAHAALGIATGSEEFAQIRTNNQHTKLDQAMPVRTPQ